MPVAFTPEKLHANESPCVTMLEPFQGSRRLSIVYPVCYHAFGVRRARGAYLSGGRDVRTSVAERIRVHLSLIHI